MTKPASPVETDFSLSVSQFNGTAIVDVRGSFDVFAADAFRSLVKDQAYRGAQSFIIDLSEAAHIDGSGISALIEMADFVRHHGATMGTIAGSLQTRKLFAVLGVDRSLTMIGSPYPKR